MRHPSYFSSYTQRACWKGRATSVGCIRSAVGSDAGAMRPVYRLAPVRHLSVYRFGGVEWGRLHDGGAAIARNPDALVFHIALEPPAPTMLLQEGGERGEEVRHGSAKLVVAVMITAV